MHLQGTSTTFAVPMMPVVITPHPGEMARLIEGHRVHYIHRVDVARDLAMANNLFVVLKGFRTVVAAPDGSVYITYAIRHGDRRTGDILTGMIAGIVAQEHFGTLSNACVWRYISTTCR